MKKWLKNTALLAGGAGAGAAATTALDHVAGKHLGKHWNKLSPNAKRLVVGPALGLALVGSRLLSKKLQETHSE